MTRLHIKVDSRVGTVDHSRPTDDWKGYKTVYETRERGGRPITRVRNLRRLTSLLEALR